MIHSQTGDRILLLPPGKDGRLFSLFCRNVIKLLIAAAILCTLGPLLASGATIRWAPSSNRILVENGGSATLSDIKAALPSAPLDLVDPTNKIWRLRANLLIKDGSVLVLHGTGAGGDVNEFRLQSLNTVATGSVVSVVADYGTLDISHTKVISWDSGADGPDIEYKDFGRAYILARSSLATNGVTPLESRMNITNSEIAYLGYNASDSYGLVWKVGGANPSPTSSIFDVVNVYGNVVNSDIHDNYYGLYTLGAAGMLCSSNQIHGNVQYGVNLQDDSDALVIRGNNIHHNGNHGLQASDRCDHLTLQNNVSRFNARGGIVLVRASNDSVVEGNECSDNGENGLVLSASSRGTVRGNTLMRNGRAGVQLDLGSADNRVENNQSSSNAVSGIILLQGSGPPEPGDNGRPKRNIFAGNRIEGNGGDPLNLTDSDDNLFATNSFGGAGMKLRFKRGLRNVVDRNTIPGDLPIRTEGDTNLTASTLVRHQSLFRVELSTNGTMTAEDSLGQVCQADERSLSTEVSGSGTSLLLTSAGIGGSSTVTARNFYVGAAPGNALLNNLVWAPATVTEWSMRAGAAGQNLNFRLGDLAANTSYVVRKGNGTLTNLTSDASGQIAFSDVASTTNAVVYSVEKFNSNPSPTTVQFSAALNRISVRGSGSTTLSDIKAALQSVPLDLVDGTNKIWLLRADLQVQDGCTLVLHGSGAGGDVNELRLLSLDNGATGSVVSVTADWGTLDIDSTKITSWNTAIGGPDTNHVAFGRAYLLARSSLSTNGLTPLESRMNIRNSEIAYLGCNASDSYGLVWKVGGANPSPTNSIFDLVNVYGDVVHSDIHDNYYGLYTLGASGMLCSSNQIHGNAQYGLNLEDDSDALVIEGNNIHHNGNHGLQASDRCDHLTIQNNVSRFNAKSGILLARSSNDGVIKNNDCSDNGENGVVLSASSRGTVQGNTLMRNARSGLQLDLGSADNRVESNQSASNTLSGITLLKGSGTPEPGDDGRPKRNSFAANRIQNNGAGPINLVDSDDNVFASNTFTDLSGKLRFQRGLRNAVGGNSIPATLVLRTEGDTNALASTIVRSQELLKVELGLNGSTVFEDVGGLIYQPDEGVIATEVSPSGSSLTLTPAGIGGSSTVIARNFHVQATPGSALLNNLVWAPATVTEWSVTAGAIGQNLNFRLGDLVASTSYVVRKGNGALTNLTSDASGQIQFSDVALTTAAVVYSVEKFNPNPTTVQYSAALNRISFKGGGSATLSDIKLALPNAPLDLVDEPNKIWLLRADLQVQDGGTLVLRGGGAGGDVNELRLLSLDTGATGTVVSVTADWGKLEIESTKITSWNTDTGGPDTNVLAFGRAYILVRSSLSTNGVTALESRMDIRNSEIAYLGSDAPDSFGLVWKVGGANPNPATSIFDLVNVYGDVRNSHIHDNYHGLYTLGVSGMLCSSNEINGNLQYGLNLQDDSDALVIRGNNIHHNGNHGLQTSDRCDHLTVQDNAVRFNARSGIRMARSSNDGVIENNDCSDNGENGLVLSASARATVRGNTLMRNARSGLQLDLGSADNRIEDNQSASNTLSGITLLRGSGTPEPGDDGRPKRNSFAGNRIQDNGADPINLADSDDNVFASNTITETSGKLRFQRGLRNAVGGNTIPATLVVRTEGDTNALASTIVRSQGLLKVELGLNGSTVFEDVGGLIYQPDEGAIATEVSGGGSSLTLTAAGIGGSSTVSARNFRVQAAPGTALVHHLVWTNATSRQWSVTSDAPGQSLNFAMGELAAGTDYVVFKAGVVLTNLQSDASGQIQFPDIASGTNATTYALAVATPNNVPPSLPLQVDHVIGASTTLVVTNTATDPDTPAPSLRYVLISAPTNAAISAAGIITWTPMGAQSPSTNIFTTVVTDSGMPPLSATNSFLVVVNRAFPALDPALPPGGNFGLTHWRLTLPDKNATDILPADLAAGFTDPRYFYTDTDGAMKFWCPVTGGTTQGSEFPRSELREVLNPGDPSVNWPGQGAHRLDAQCKVTQVPERKRVIIGQIHSYTVATYPLVKLEFVDGALEAKVKISPNDATNETKYTFGNIGLGNLISYQLQIVDGVLSMTVNGTTYTENIFEDDPAWSDQTFYFKAGSYCQDNDGPDTEGAAVSFYQLNVAHNFTPNSPPSLPALPDLVVAELTPLVITNTATDPDLPATTVSYVLQSGPQNSLISASGVITWTPTEAQGPSTNLFVTVATDNGVPRFSATNTFLVVVTEANSAPTLPPLNDVTLGASSDLQVTNTAIDVDVPAQLLTYTLASAPGNAVISADGIIRWTPAPGQSPSTNVFTTVVTDNGVPPLSATNSFTVVIPEPQTVQPVVVRILAGAGNGLVLSWSSPSPDWILQESTTLEASDWANSTNTVEILPGQQYQVVIPAASPNTFFRLIQP